MRSVFLLLCAVLAALPQELKLRYRTHALVTIEQRLRQAPARNAERETALRRLFEEAGCKAGNLSEEKVDGSASPNLICTQPGETKSAIVVSAHFDFAEPRKGLLDNWSGAALLPSLFESLAGERRRHTFIFAGFTGGEQHQAGSRSYLKRLSNEQAANVRAAVNLHCLGLSNTKVRRNGSHTLLTRRLGEVAAGVGLRATATDAAWQEDSDAAPFSVRDVPAIELFSIDQHEFPALRWADDEFDGILLDEYYRTYRLVTAYLAYLDLTLE